jgi:hypothetical protein
MISVACSSERNIVFTRKHVKHLAVFIEIPDTITSAYTVSRVNTNPLIDRVWNGNHRLATDNQSLRFIFWSGHSMF